MKVNHIQRIFDDAYKSPLSVRPPLELWHGFGGSNADMLRSFSSITLSGLLNGYPSDLVSVIAFSKH